MSIEKLKANHGVTTSWVAFPLHPNTPPEGILMKDLYKNRDPDQMKATGDYLKSQMVESGLAYNRRTRLDNSRLAQELGAWADTQVGGDAFHDAMFKAYFVDDRNIGEVDELVAIAGSVGLNESEARETLTQRSFSPNVTRDWERAWSEGVTGVPTFTARDLFVFGCQPYEVLLRFFNHLKKLRAEDDASA